MSEQAAWKPGNEVLGYWQDGGLLSWLKVLNAGHITAADQPLLIDAIREKLMSGGKDPL
jgi:cathepsin A (carboxypeptidase C)